MTREEALKQIEELKKFIEDCDRKVGFEDDELFLLSAEEYEHYEDKIPHINNWWWLRSPDDSQKYAAFVDLDGSVYYDGYYIGNKNLCVRPALHLGSDFPVGRRIMKYQYPWIVIDKRLAIAETPIAFREFDDSSNDYEKSGIRKFLKEWVEERK